MPNQYVYNSYQQLYSPSIPNGSLNVVGASPTFTNMNYNAPNSAESSASSTTSSMGSSMTGTSSNYSFHTPRLRYYLSKSFDIEDDMEFCPDIPEIAGNSPPTKRFNPYTASVFSPVIQPESNHEPMSPMNSGAQSPRIHTPRIKKPLEIVNPQTKMRVSSPAIHNK